jgi:hypothetical protein
MVHAALLLLMLEAVPTDLVFTISLKRSTQNLQLSTSSPADYPIFTSDSGRTLAVHSSKIQPAARNVRSRIIKRVSPQAHILITPALKLLATRH